MTLCAFWAKTAQKRLKMTPISKFRITTKGTLEKDGTHSDFVHFCIEKVKKALVPLV